MVEFALASSVLVLLLGGIFDLGLALHNYTLLQHVTDTSTRELASQLNTRPQCDQIRRYLDTVSTPTLRDTLGVSMSGEQGWSMEWDAPGFSGQYPTLRIRGWFSSGCYFLCRLTPNAFRVSASSEITIERTGLDCGGAQF